MLKSKLFASAVAFTMVLSMVAIPASAQTAAELTAQINSLLAMIAQLQAQIAGQGGQVPLGSAAQGPAVLFNTDLTVGSTGSDVTALQQWLVQKGDLQMPAGVAYGYFGSITKAALARYQASAGITPAVGYFGPITRARLNAMFGTTGTTGGTVNCPIGYTCTSTGGTTTGGITTPGVEGTLTVTNSNAGLVSTAYEGDSKDAILGFKVEAKSSDIAIQRIKINLGTSNKVYNKIYSKIYVTDADGNVLTSSDLNSNTVVKESSTYYITLSGFSYVVPKDTTKQMYIKADVYSSIDTTDITAWNLINTITLANDGVRGVDGAGIDQYSPTTGSDVTKGVTVASTLSDSASLSVSLNSSSPAANSVVASDGSGSNELDQLTLLTFDLQAKKDDVLITDMRVGAAKTGGAATAVTAYLYDGSTELDSASIANGMASFSDLNYTVPKDSTKTLTLKVDIRTADGTVANFVGTASTTIAADLVAENSAGNSVTPTGSATGYTIGVRNAGPEITLVSKSVTTSGVPQVNGISGGSASTTATLTATFNVNIKAVGSSLLLGSVASGTPVFSVTGASNSFKVYLNGVAAVTSNATSSSFQIPSNCVVNATNGCVLADGSSVTIPVTFQIPGRNAAYAGYTSGLYSVGLEKVNWTNNTTGVPSSSTFMAGLVDWRTADVSFP